MNEAETCRTLVRPKLEEAGWDGNKHFYSEQTAFTDGRIIVPAGKPRRQKKSSPTSCSATLVTLLWLSLRPSPTSDQPVMDFSKQKTMPRSWD